MSESKYCNLKSGILILLISLMIYGACTQGKTTESRSRLNFTINGDNAQPKILLGILNKTDSNLCYKALVGIPITLKTELEYEIAQWTINGKPYSGQKIQFQLEKPGIFEVVLFNKTTSEICKKFIYIRTNETQTLRSDFNGDLSNFNCSKLQFSNNRFYATISGLPDGLYHLIVLENRKIKNYRTNSINREAIIRFDTSYSVRPEVILRSVTNSLNNGINCIFLANQSL